MMLEAVYCLATVDRFVHLVSLIELQGISYLIEEAKPIPNKNAAGNTALSPMSSSKRSGFRVQVATLRRLEASGPCCLIRETGQSSEPGDRKDSCRKEGGEIAAR